MIAIAFTYYPLGGEHTQWFTLPAVPRIGDWVHLPTGADDDPGSIGLRVRHVSWSNDDPDHPGWHAEIGLE